MTTDTDKPAAADTSATPSTTTAESGSNPTTTTTATKKTVAAPEQWPDEAKEQYEPIRTLGVGGFGSVMLARNKTAAKDDPNKFVAVKVAGSKDVTKMDIGYARREIDIVRELNHPNIMRLIQAWDPPPNSRTCAAVMALSYASGTPLQNLLQHGGALSICFGRVVMAQLIDALAYLHSRAVVHRDIKPDNVIVTGASASQDAIWEDDKNGDPESTDWKALLKKWHVTLCDFGFARAMGPDDLQQSKIAAKRGSVNLHTVDGSKHLDSSRGSKTSLNQSVSHRFKRSMSALGNRLYAAPEIINGVNNDPTVDIDLGEGNFDIMQTLSHHISNYGMLADSYSLGNTMKFMMTGAQPDQNADEVIATQNNPIVKSCVCLSNMMCTSNQATTGGLQKRTIQYRPMKKLPTELVKLIRGLTHPSVAQRTSIRAARRYFWIDEILDEATSPELFPQTIDYLPCALKMSSVGVETTAKELGDEPAASAIPMGEIIDGMEVDA